jgi:hypothetical protein
MEASIPLDAWLPSKLTLYAGKHKRALLVIKAGIPAEAGTAVLLLARRAGDDLVLQVPGVVSKARRSYVEIRLPWDAAVSLAVFTGRKIGANSPEGKVVIHDYVVKIKQWRPPLRQ